MGCAPRLILKEAWHRKGSFLLSTLAVAAAVALYVAISITQKAAQNETRRTTRDIGSNVRIIPRDADALDFHRRGYSEETMPEDAIERMATAKGISYNHLIARLTNEITIANRKVLLVGDAGALHPPGRKKKSKMGFKIQEGTVYLGHGIARMLGKKKNEQVDLLGHKFKIARVEPEKGTIDDFTIFALLDDAQKILDKEDQINEIRAIDCLCLTADQNPQEILRRELDRILPEAKVFHIVPIADARAKLRQASQRYAAFLLPVVLVGCAAFVGVLAVINVRERTGEIGVLRALGFGSPTVGALVLGRAVLIGLVAAAVGFAAGCWLAVSFGPNIFPVTAKSIRPEYALLGWSLVAAPVYAAVASLIPAAVAVAHDPAETLRHE